MMKKEQYVSLYEACAAGEGTEQKKKLLEEYQDAFTLEDLPWNEARLGDQRQVTERVYRRLQERMHILTEGKQIVLDNSNNGVLARQKSIFELLKNLELTGSIHFSMEDRPGQAERGIIVMP